MADKTLKERIVEYRARLLELSGRMTALQEKAGRKNCLMERLYGLASRTLDNAASFGGCDYGRGHDDLPDRPWRGDVDLLYPVGVATGLLLAAPDIMDQMDHELKRRGC